jgi:hypothetical protein
MDDSQRESTSSPTSGFASHCFNIANKFHESERVKNMILAKAEYENLKQVLVGVAENGNYRHKIQVKRNICSCLIELLEEDNFVCHNQGRAAGNYLMNIVDIEW